MSSTAINQQTVTGISAEVAREFQQTVTGCGIVDLSSRAKLALTGGDRVRWLNGMITNNVRDLAQGRGVYAFLLNPQGHILADLYAYNRGDSIVVDTDQAHVEKILATFDHYIIMDDVEVTNVSDKMTAIAVAGPKAEATLREIGLELGAIEKLQFVDISWREKSVTLVRGDHAALDWYEIWGASDIVQSIREALNKAGAIELSEATVELLRVAAGMPRYGVDIRERDLPQETSQDRALNFSKGCYIGQEIVERIRSRGAVHRKFTGFEVQGPLPVLGTKVRLNGKDVGEITSTAILPVNGERKVALGYIRREIVKPEQELLAGETRVTVASLPFNDIFGSAS